ncbi:hypothetical protein G7054_g6381 [Neopestalotiopsis clavispora]|nr:hypothetical protein G7054_g6381 [Neopestalotiopsis clavispora]
MDGHEYAPSRNPSCTPQPNESGIRREPQCSGVYGFTEADERVPGQFVILIAAQMIWPLLVPEYSTSEKLCCHFMIAVTILHEIMHATHFATAFMCGRLGKQHPPDQEDCVSKLLEQAGAELFDMTHADGEPYWKNDPWAELGSAFEHETFGMLTGTLPVLGSTSRMITMQPLLLEGYSHPTVFCDNRRYLPVDRPIVDFSQPIRIDWLATRFDQGWWDEQVTRCGLETAGRLTNPAHSYYTLTSCNWADEKALARMMGSDSYTFAKTVWTLLHRRGMTSLADYCKHLVWSANEVFGIKSRLRAEHHRRVDYNRWGLKVDPLPEAMEELETASWLGLRILECWSNGDHEEGFREWKTNVPGQQIAWRNQDLQSWRDEMSRHIQYYFCKYGAVLQGIAKIHHIYVRELGKIGQYVHEYFRQEPAIRSFLWPPGEGQSCDDDFDWVVVTLGAYRRTASVICDLATSIGRHPVFRNTRVPHWMNHWAEIFDAFFQAADALYRGLLADRGQRLAAADVHQLLINIKAPSSIWLSKGQQTKSAAEQEYRRASKGIRATVDELCRRAAILQQPLKYNFDTGNMKAKARLRAPGQSKLIQKPAYYLRIADISNLIAAYAALAQCATPRRITGERPAASSIAKALSMSSRPSVRC